MSTVDVAGACVATGRPESCRAGASAGGGAAPDVGLLEDRQRTIAVRAAFEIVPDRRADERADREEHDRSRERRLGEPPRHWGRRGHGMRDDGQCPGR